MEEELNPISLHDRTYYYNFSYPTMKYRSRLVSVRLSVRTQKRAHMYIIYASLPLELGYKKKATLKHLRSLNSLSFVMWI